MKAYSKDITKEQFVAETKLHQKLDHFIKGTYLEGDKGCAVGCAVKSINKLIGRNVDGSYHRIVSYQLDVPLWLVYTQDALFEEVSASRSKLFPVEFAEAINEGADLELIKTPFICYILENNIAVQKYNLKNTDDKELQKYIRSAIGLTKDMITACQEQDGKRIGSIAMKAYSRHIPSASELDLLESAYCVIESIKNIYHIYIFNSINCIIDYAVYVAESQSTKIETCEKFADKLLQLMRECK